MGCVSPASQASSLGKRHTNRLRRLTARSPSAARPDSRRLAPGPLGEGRSSSTLTRRESRASAQDIRSHSKGILLCTGCRREHSVSCEPHHDRSIGSVQIASVPAAYSRPLSLRCALPGTAGRPRRRLLPANGCRLCTRRWWLGKVCITEPLPKVRETHLRRCPDRDPQRCRSCERYRGFPEKFARGRGNLASRPFPTGSPLPPIALEDSSRRACSTCLCNAC